MATRESRRRSIALTAPGIDPIRNWPSTNSTSVPLIRGEPLRRSVAIVRCLRDDMSERTRAANSGSAAANSDHVAILILIYIGQGRLDAILFDKPQEAFYF